MTETKQTRIARKLSIATAILMTVWSLAVLAIERHWSVPLWDFLIALGFASIPWMLNRGWSYLGRNALVTLTNLTLLLFPALFGENAGTHYCFLPATALPFAFFQVEDRKSLAYGVLLPMALFILLMATDFNLVTHYGELPRHTWIFWFTVGCAFFLSFIPIYFFSRASSVAEAALRVSEQKYIQIVENAEEGIWVITTEGITTHANPAMSRMLGYAPHEMLGRSILEFIDQDSHQGAIAALERRNKGQAERFEYKLRHRDGRIVPVLVSASPHYGKPGEPSQAIALVLDLTDAKRQERLLEEQKAKMMTSAKLSALGEMAAGIAHEVNNPLAALNLRIGMLRNHIKKGEVTSERALKTTEEMDRILKRAVRIIDGLRTFSRDEESAPFTRVPVKKIIDDTLSFCRERFMVHGIELKVDDVAEDVTIKCRPVQVSQVLLNLLNNAFDAVSDQPLRRIEVRTDVESDSVTVSVVDNGPGVPYGAQAKLFQPFFTTKPVGQGTGLGLAVSKGIVEAHLGELSFESKPGLTRFCVKLPRAST